MHALGTLFVCAPWPWQSYSSALIIRTSRTWNLLFLTVELLGIESIERSVSTIIFADVSVFPF